jgi:hypothetical protein
MTLKRACAERMIADFLRRAQGTIRIVAPATVENKYGERAFTAGR